MRQHKLRGRFTVGSRIYQNKYKFLLLFILLSFPLWTGFLISVFSVNVPYWDDWITPGFLLEKINSNPGNLSFSDFIAQHNESRLIFPKFIFLAIAYFTNWDVRFGMFLSLFAAFLVSVNLYLMVNKTIETMQKQEKIQSLLLVGVCNMLAFSPAQYDNWLWSIQIVYFIPILCLTTGINTLYSKIKLAWKVIIVVMLSTVSTFSYSSGLICWLLLPLTAVLLGQCHVLRKHVELVVFWAVACASNLILYFWNYSKPLDTPSLVEGLFYPLKTLNYFFAFLGSPLAGGNLVIASVVGFFAVLITGVSSTFFIMRWGNKSLRYRAAGWATLLTYSLISAIITTFGRIGFGVEQAMSPRYTTFSVYGIIGLLGLITIASNEIQAEADRIAIPRYLRDNYFVKKVIRYSPLFLAISLIITQVLLQNYYINAMDVMRRERLYSKACLTYVDFVEDNCITQSLLNLPNVLRKNLKATRELGILRREDFAQSSQLQSIQKTASVSYNYGWIDGIKAMSGDDFVASGWAILENSGRTADAVLLSYQDNEGKPKIFTVAPVKFDRPDVSKVKQNSSYARSGWAVVFSGSSLPPGKVTVTAWAYDVKTKTSYPLNGSYSLR